MEDWMGDDVRRLEWEAACKESLARLDADPVALADYQAESRALAECDVTVVEDYGMSGGVELTEELVNRLADEAEVGYDVDAMRGRLRSDPPL